MSLLHKFLLLSFVLFGTSCGFQPLYVGQASQEAISGTDLIQETASVFVNEIPERTGQVLRRALKNGLSPKGEPIKPKYRLSVQLSKPSLSEQAVGFDDFATRYTMMYTASYMLYTYPENKLILKDSSLARTSYDVQNSPYATDVAEQAAKERIMKTLGEDISLRLAAFLKSYDVSPKTPLSKEKAQ